MKKATKLQKQTILRLFFEQNIIASNDITVYMGVSLSLYNWSIVLDQLEGLLKENDNFDDWKSDLKEYRKLKLN